MRYKDFAKLNESSTCGATGSANVATAVQPFMQANPEYEYGGKTFNRKKKKEKPVVIKRNP